MLKILTHSAIQTKNTAEEFSHKLKRGDIVAFFGDLGAGKTTFMQGVAAGLKLESPVYSPTFAIANDYGSTADGTRVFHFDMYRITDEDSLYSVGFFDYIDDDSIVFIEWSENIKSVLDEMNYISVNISRGENENDRIIEITGGDGRW